MSMRYLVRLERGEENTNRNDGVVQSALATHIKSGSHIVSDAEHGCATIPYMGRGYLHTVIKGRAGEYSKNGHTTNSIERFWNLVQRRVEGTYFSVSDKHMQTYLSEFEFRYNLRPHPDMVLPLLRTGFTRGS